MESLSFSELDRDLELSKNIVEAMGFINRYIDGLDLNQFLLETKTQDAVSMRLQQILECASKLSAESKSSLKIDWASLTAMRNKISHHYVDIDSELVWEVITDFDQFKKLIEWARLRHLKSS